MDSIELIRLLKKTYPYAKCSLTYENPFQLFIAVILSAQCTDERVNKVTPLLFNKYKTPKDLAITPPEVLEKEIHSCGFYKTKAKTLITASQLFFEKYKNKVPASRDELTAITGIGRKSANVIIGNAYGIPGLPVDTHVTRTSYRLGLTKNTHPVKIELDLMKIIPETEWTLFSHLLIYLGRDVCKARNPICESCALQNICPKKGLIFNDDNI